MGIHIYLRKSFTCFIVLLFVFNTSVFAAFLKNVPVEISQPDGTKLMCYATGDEYYNWLHDENNYTIVRDSKSGYYVYADVKNSALVSTSFVVGKDNPANVGLKPGINVFPEVVDLKSSMIDDINNAPSTGDYNNIVVFIRFADQNEFDESLVNFDNMFNGDNFSLRGYFKEVSGEQLYISSTFYPSPNGDVIVSYQDQYNRDYYEVYDSISNPNGYKDGERNEREHTLLQNAILSVRGELESSGLNFDSDDDNYIDNVCFIIEGNAEGWSNLLWPHKWSLYSKEVKINGDRVWEYNFQLSDRTNVSVLCHEMFHTLGAPDLYHYSGDGLSPVGGWDLMASDNAQHMTTWMKHKYGSWFSSIPEITESGTYKLPAVGNNPFACYKIPVDESNTEFFMVEFRKRVGYDSNIYGSYDEGLLVYRINEPISGNRNGPPDEIYVLRPEITGDMPNGMLHQATLSFNENRVQINGESDPLAKLQDETISSLHIFDVGVIGDSIEFKVNLTEVNENNVVINSLSPESPSVISVGNFVRIDFSYTSLYKNINILIQPFNDGRLLDNFYLSDSPLYSSQSGVGMNFLQLNMETFVDSLRFQFVDTTEQQNILFERFLPVDYHFKEWSLSDSCKNIGLVGTFNDWGNQGPDIPFVQNEEDSTEWFLTYHFTEDSEVKLRQDENWTINWGDDSFPSGVAYQDGPNIVVPAGYYTIYFNCVTQEYSFEQEDYPNLALLSLENPNVSVFPGRLCNPGIETIVVKLTNNGNVPLYGYSIAYDFGGVRDVFEDSDLTILPGDTIEHSFQEQVDLYTNEYYENTGIRITIPNDDMESGDNALYADFRVFGDYSFEDGWTAFNTCTHSLTTDISWDIAEDKNGDIWFTDSFGAYRFDGNTWHTYTKADGLADNTNWAITNDNDGNIWFSGSDTIITKFDGTAFTQYPQPAKFNEFTYVDSKGNIWFGSITLEDVGLAMYDGANWNYYWGEDIGLEKRIRNISEDVNGNIIVLGESNIGSKFRMFDGETWNDYFIPEHNGQVNIMHYDSHGNTWFCGLECALKFDGENWVEFEPIDGILSSYCKVISEDSFGNIWFGGGRELSKYDGTSWCKYVSKPEFAVALPGSIYPVYTGLAAADGGEITSLFGDKKGNIWCGTNGGGIAMLQQEEPIECTQHFHPVWEGNFGQDHMNLNVVNATLGGEALVSGDEVGVFDGDICVGYGKVEQTISNESILSLIVSRDDGSGNGFTVRNEITYRFWDCSENKEYGNVSTSYFDNNPSWSTTGLFETGATSFVELEALNQVCLNVELNTGWNIMSVNNTIADPDMLVTFQPVIDQNLLVKIQDEEGRSLENWGIFGGWKNNIGDISPTEGYKVKVNSSTNLEICGQSVDFPYQIQLNSGWNIVGYPHQNCYDGLDVMQPLIDNKRLIKVQDEKGNSIENWGIFGGWQNNIGDFLPGKGYKIKVATDDVLSVVDNYPKSTIIPHKFIATNHFKPAFTGNGLDHMNINVIDLPTNVFEIGDEMAVFDGFVCVGTKTLMPYHIKDQRITIPVSAMDTKGMLGFAEGNPFLMMVWKTKQEKEFEIVPEILNGPSVFMKHESTLVSLKKYADTGLDGLVLEDGYSLNCYPNPFIDEVTLELTLKAETKVEVTVINHFGQPVDQIKTTGLLSSGTHKLKWNACNASNKKVSSGIYHLKVKIGEKVYYRKLIYSRRL